MTDPTPTPSSDRPAGDRREAMDAQLEAEIEAALGDLSLEDMMDHADKPKPKRGEQRERKRGTIVNVHGDDVFVEFGPKSQGICPLKLFTEKPEVGSEQEFIVDRFDQEEGLLILSREGTVAKAEWESLEPGQHVEARCTGTNKGGLVMEIANHQAFMPAGQVDLRHIAELEVFVGEKMPCEVLEVDRKRGRIILSRRAHLEAERAQLREKLLADLEVGTRMPAKITTLKPYGAFADLGGMDGLIHISDMSYSRINDPSEVVKEGDDVEVQILKVDTSSDPPRIGLGLKQCMADPSEAAMAELAEGATVSGRVTKIMDFGAFVELSPGVEGLIHISELAHERVKSVAHVVKQDEIVTVKVLNIDQQSKRIGLSIKALKAAPDGSDGSGDRGEDAAMRKLKAQLGKKFGDNLKGGLS